MKKDKKTEILRVACRLFSEYGYEKSSIERIAAQAGVAVGLVRYYFRTKENLYFEAARSVMTGLRDHLRGLDFTDLVPDEAVKRFVQEYMRHTTDPRNAYWMIYQESPFVILRHPACLDAMTAVSMEIVEVLQALLVRVWPGDLARTNALLLIASLHGIQRVRFSSALREIVSFDDVGAFFKLMVKSEAGVPQSEGNPLSYSLVSGSHS